VIYQLHRPLDRSFQGSEVMTTTSVVLADGLSRGRGGTLQGRCLDEQFARDLAAVLSVPQAITLYPETASWPEHFSENWPSSIPQSQRGGVIRKRCWMPWERGGAVFSPKQCRAEKAGHWQHSDAPHPHGIPMASENR